MSYSPYKHTAVAAKDTQQQINALIWKYLPAVEKIAWDITPPHASVMFPIGDKVVQLEVPDDTQVKSFDQAMRCLYWLLKPLLEMAGKGYPIETLFLSHFVIHDPRGRLTTMTHQMLPTLKQKALTPQQIPMLGVKD
jgi:hypothetical protein